MAHYAFLDENNVVVQVITGKNESNFDWEQYYGNLHGMLCKRTSYNTIGGVHREGKTPFRKNYAGIGYTYDADRDAFIPPKFYASWILDEFSCLWNPPIPMPTEGGSWTWDEESQSWVEVEE